MSCAWETRWEIRGEEETSLLPSLLIRAAIFWVFSMLTFDCVSVLTTDFTATFSATAVWATAEPVVVVASRPTDDMIDCSRKLEETSRSEREHSSMMIHLRTPSTQCSSLSPVEKRMILVGEDADVFIVHGSVIFLSPSQSKLNSLRILSDILARTFSSRFVRCRRHVATFVRIADITTDRTNERNKYLLSPAAKRMCEKEPPVSGEEKLLTLPMREDRKCSAYIGLLRFTFLTLRSDW